MPDLGPLKWGSLAVGNGFAAGLSLDLADNPANPLPNQGLVYAWGIDAYARVSGVPVGGTCAPPPSPPSPPSPPPSPPSPPSVTAPCFLAPAQSVAVGFAHGCVIDGTGQLVFNVSNYDNLVSNDGNLGGNLVCWGLNHKGQARVPAAVNLTWLDLSSAGNYSCELWGRSRRCVCWSAGSNMLKCST